MKTVNNVLSCLVVYIGHLQHVQQFQAGRQLLVQKYDSISLMI